jgi:hypothetical protein
MQATIGYMGSEQPQYTFPQQPVNTCPYQSSPGYPSIPYQSPCQQTHDHVQKQPISMPYQVPMQQPVSPDTQLIKVAGPEMRSMEIVVPQCAFGGSLLQITDPQTRQTFQVIVPDGLHPGMRFLVQMQSDRLPVLKESEKTSSSSGGHCLVIFCFIVFFWVGVKIVCG